jgi:hypothetical protein
MATLREEEGSPFGANSYWRPTESFSVLVSTVRRETDAIELRASPRKPNVASFSKETG